VNKAQRKLVIMACIGVAVLMHTYFGEWVKDHPGDDNPVNWFSYTPDHPLDGLRVSSSSRGGGYSATDEYADLRQFVLFFVGILAPIVTLAVAGYILLATWPWPAWMLSPNPPSGPSPASEPANSAGQPKG
jgi:hypothetical protein